MDNWVSKSHKLMGGTERPNLIRSSGKTACIYFHAVSFLHFTQCGQEKRSGRFRLCFLSVSSCPRPYSKRFPKLSCLKIPLTCHGRSRRLSPAPTKTCKRLSAQRCCGFSPVLDPPTASLLAQGYLVFPPSATGPRALQQWRAG